MNNIELADKVRDAHDNILKHGWRQGSTEIGYESDGLCIGSALAMAFDQKGAGDYIWNYGAFTASSRETDGLILYASFLCDNGKVLTPYLRDAIDEVSGYQMSGFVNSWNDQDTTTEDMVLDVLLSTEKALRETDE